MAESPILDRLMERRDAARGSIAIRALGRLPLTYEGLCQQVKSGVARLRRAGIRREDRVAMVSSAGPEMATACLSVCSAAACVPLNPDYRAAEFERFFEALEAKLLIVEAGSATAAPRVAHELGIPILELRAVPSMEAGRFELFAPGGTAGAASEEADDFAGPDDVVLVLHTSGSTAEPKVVPLKQCNLVASAENIVRSLDLAAADCALNMLPLFHIGGSLDLLIAPLWAGGSAVLATDMSSGTLVDCCRAFAPTWYQGVPTMLLDLLRCAESDPAALEDVRFRFIRSVSAPLPEATRSEIERVFDAPVIEMYGMTETAGLIASNPLPPGIRKPGSVGVAAGPEVMVIDTEGNPARASQSGEVLVRGPSVMRGYEGKPDLNEAVFIGEWLRTGDQGYLDEDGYLFLTGRIKEIINRGGEKISPREIDEVAAQHPKVLEAAAFAIPHESLGEEVGIAVVASSVEGDGDLGRLSESELIEHLSGSLAYFKVPRVVHFVESLPRTPSGKLKRLELAAQFGERGAARRGAEWVAPTGARAIAIARIWERLLGVGPVGMQDNFFDLGGDSLTAAKFTAALRSEAGYTMQLASLFDAPTVAELEVHLEEVHQRADDRHEVGDSSEEEDRLDQIRAILAGWPGRRARSESLIVGQNTLGSRRPLYWCSNGGKEFKKLAQGLGPDQPLYGMRSIRKFDWKSPASLVQVAKRYAAEILELQSAGPYMLGGYCDGGRMAFEIARQLQEGGRQVSLLCLNDIFIPQPYSGRVALFFSAPGTAGRHSPYQTFERPETGIRKYYDGDVTVHLADWGHMGFYKRRNIATFVAQLKRAMALAESGVVEVGRGRGLLPRIEADLQILSDEDCRLEIEARLPRQLRPGERTTVLATVTNRSSVTWEPSDRSGIMLRNRWRNRDGAGERIWFDGSACLSTSVEAGASLVIEIEIRAPTTPGRWLLYLDLVDEGASWFGFRGAPKFRSGVRVSKRGGVLRLLGRVWPASLSSR